MVTATAPKKTVKRQAVNPAPKSDAAPARKSRTVKVEPKVVAPEVVEDTEIVEEANTTTEKELPALSRKDVAPRPFRSEMVELGAISGWDTGDPPDDDFITDVSANGIEVPIAVVKTDDGYVAKDGRRRLKTAALLLESGRKEFGKVPVVIDSRANARDPRFASLAMNYQRGENIIGDARTVMALKDEGFSEKAIASRSGLKIEQVRALRKIMTDLDPRLIALVEEGRMKPWAARQAAQKAPEVQARLIELAGKKDRITPEDVTDAHRANVIQTSNGMDNSALYDGEEFPAEESEEAALADGFAPTPTKKGAKVSWQTRVENASRFIGLGKQELLGITAKQRSSAVQAALDSLDDALRLLVNGEDVVEDIAAYDAAEEADAELDEDAETDDAEDRVDDDELAEIESDEDFEDEESDESDDDDEEIEFEDEEEEEPEENEEGEENDDEEPPF